MEDAIKKNEELEELEELEEDESINTNKGKCNKILKSIERDRRGTLISYYDFRQANSVVASWFDRILAGTGEIHVFKMEDSSFKLILVTTLHEYYIRVRGIVGDKDSYLGCIYNNRAADPGETWIRGSDFPDGKLIINVFLDIIYAIVGNECLKLKGVVGYV